LWRRSKKPAPRQKRCTASSKGQGREGIAVHDTGRNLTLFLALHHLALETAKSVGHRVCRPDGQDIANVRDVLLEDRLEKRDLEQVPPIQCLRAVGGDLEGVGKESAAEVLVFASRVMGRVVGWVQGMDAAENSFEMA